MMNGQAKVFNFQKFLIKSLQTTAPGFFHPCPYMGKHSIFNASASKDVMEIFPLGTFKLTFKAFDKVEKNILTISAYANVFKS